MEYVTLGRTGITVGKNGFGALPIQRISRDEAAYIVQTALDGGMTFFDTARSYTDSEEKLGYALSHRRDEFYLATKTPSTTAKGFWADLETSLRLLKTDHVDLYQFHNPAFCPKPGDGSGLYEAMLEAKKQGKIRFIGITNHRLHVAQEAIDSGLYDVLQYPFCYLATEKDHTIQENAARANMGFLAMKGLSGGLITNAKAAAAWLNQYPDVLPIWGIQHRWELEEFLSFRDNPPAMDEEVKAVIAKDRRELTTGFCRSCGYCMPCPAGIQILNCARMSQLIRRAPAEGYFSPEWRENMRKIEDCIGCGQCKSRCPFELDVPNLLRKNYEDYKQLCAQRDSGV